MKTKYFFQLAGLSALWGASFMLTRVAVPALGPSLTACMRMVFATLVLGFIMRRLHLRWPVEHWRELTWLGFLAVAGPHLLFARSAVDLPAGYSALISVVSVPFGAFASAWMREENLNFSKLFGCLLGIVGVALVVRLGPVQPNPTLVIASLVCLGAAGISGLSTPFLKKAITHMEPLQVTAGMHAMAVVLLLPGALLDIPSAHPTVPAVVAVVLMGTAASGFAYWMYMRIMRHIRPMAAQSSTFMCTGFGVLWAVLLLDEPTSIAMFVGGGFILIACLLVMGINPLPPSSGGGWRGIRSASCHRRQTARCR